MNPAVATKGWRARLEQAIEDEVGVHSAEWSELFRLASSWQTCAVGENAKMLNTKGYSFSTHGVFSNTLVAPGSGEHRDLGMDFMLAVEHARWSEALNILTRIENLPTKDTQ